MSTYYSFYAKDEKDNFVRVYCGSTNATVARRIRHLAPYEKIALLSTERIDSIINDIQDDINTHNSNIKYVEDMVQKVLDSKGTTLEEKQEWVHDLQAELDDIEREEGNLEDLQLELGVFTFMQRLDCKVYIGCESGEFVTKEDIQE